MAAGESGNQAQDHGEQGIGCQHFMRREAADEPGTGEAADKEAHHGAGQIVGGETGRHAGDLFDSVANQIAPAGGLRADVAELRQHRPAPVANADQASKGSGEGTLVGVTMVVALQGRKFGQHNQQSDQ